VTTPNAIASGDLSVRAVSTCTLTTRVLRESYRIMREQLPTTLFTRLGALFFRTLIRNAVKNGNADLVVARQDSGDRVDGFALLTHTSSWISETVRRYPAAFAMAAGSAAVRPRVWQQLASRGLTHFSTPHRAQNGPPAPELPALPEPSLYVIAVRPEREGLGIGRALLGEVERSVMRAGNAHYTVYTASSNHRANRFYLRNGLAHVGNQRPADMDMNVYVKEVG